MKKINQKETKNAIIVEDDPVFVKSISFLLKRLGWIILGSADSYENAVILLEQLNQIQIDIALIDGFLKTSEGYITDTNLRYQAQGGKVSELIKKTSPETTTVGISSLGYLQKADKNIDQVVEKDPRELKIFLQSLE